ncbi:type II secretion system secretin GspD [Microbaculum sp. FT89]|uniref:type II secretion system secretin GspD n=1 Tax=Microbaculum sp. FT89 TaxID=3447298 RepID=UPI003F532E24
MHLRLVFRLTLLLLVGLSVVSCQTTEDLLSVRGSGNRLFGSVLNADLTARQADPGAANAQGIQRVDGGEPVIYPADGAGATGGPFVPATAGDGGGSYRLNFENAQIGDVVRAILGDSLGLNYVIDPNVNGRVTLVSARPVARDELLPTLEAILRMNQAALITEGAVYRVVVDADAGNLRARMNNSGHQAGFGLTVLPLRYVSANTMMGLIDGFATKPETIRVDATRNLLLISGSAPERRTAVETVMTFDTDWMADQSVGIFPTRDVRPETMIPELERLFETQEGRAGADLIQFVPMSRMKAVLVVSKRDDLIRRAGTWISRLDRTNPAAETTVNVYRVKYRDAKLLVQILSGIFGGSTVGGSGAEEPSAADQIMPGSSVFTSSADGAEPGIDAADDGADAEGAASGTGTTFDFARSPAPGSGGGTDLFAGQTSGAGGEGPRFSADTANNSIVIYADGDTYLKILAALRQIDVPPLQVAVNVVIAEIRLNDQLKFGVQYFIKSGDVGLKDDVGSIGLFNTVANSINRELPGFNFVIGSEQSPDVIISAFDKITDVSVLSSPSLVVMENETAALQVGEEVAVSTRQAQSVINPDSPTVNEIEYRDTGIILKVTPRIAENGIISMQIQQEISDIASGASTLTPTFTKRRISSSVSVASGQTVLLGGLIAEGSDNNRTGIPVLHRLKGVGDLFGTTDNSARRNELIVLIRPTVIRQGQDAQQVAEELRARMWNMQRNATGQQ